MAVLLSFASSPTNKTPLPGSSNPNINSMRFHPKIKKISKIGFGFHSHGRFRRCYGLNFDVMSASSDPNDGQDGEVDNVGVRAALTVLRFYKGEISPLIPRSCRYVPTCSEYSMEAYKKYGFTKGTILTVWRLCRCNPLGGSGFHPPRWFDEAKPFETVEEEEEEDEEEEGV